MIEILISLLLYGQIHENKIERSNERSVISREFDLTSRADKLKRYFEIQESPLATQASEIVAISDARGIDFRLLPAISMVESSGCKNYIRSTNNCFGWGNGRIRFDSILWGFSIVGDKLQTLPAYKRWMESPERIERLASVYCPVDKEAWTQKIRGVMESIEND